MPATYTFNDGIEAAKAQVGWTINEAVKSLSEEAAKQYIDLLVIVWRDLEQLKRPSRRKRKQPDHAATLVP